MPILPIYKKHRVIPKTYLTICTEGKWARFRGQTDRFPGRGFHPKLSTTQNDHPRGPKLRGGPPSRQELQHLSGSPAGGCRLSPRKPPPAPPHTYPRVNRMMSPGWMRPPISSHTEIVMLPVLSATLHDLTSWPSLVLVTRPAES